MTDPTRLLALAEECERAADLASTLYLAARMDRATSQSEIANIAHQSSSALSDAAAALRALAEEVSDAG